MHAAAAAFDGTNTQLFAVTVDHGLRKASPGEALHAAQIADTLGIPHDTLEWTGWDGHGNVSARARDARYALMTQWARDRGVAVLALGHTADDQAETVIMRLARASGVDGLAGIPRRRMINGITLVRPLLGITRAALRAYLREQSVAWIDDPTNDDMRYERVRVRSALAQFASLGLTPDVLSDVASNMTKAREALDWYTFIAARESVQMDGGDVLIDLRRFRTLPEEIARRLLTHALIWIGGGPYQPRRDALRDALVAIRKAKTTTLHGCAVLAHSGLIWVCREFNAVRDLEVAAEKTWDDRWFVTNKAQLPNGLRLRALGKAGLNQSGDWRQTGRPHAALLSSPSIWDGDTLVAAPHAGFNGKFTIALQGGQEDFFASILSH